MLSRFGRNKKKVPVESLPIGQEQDAEDGTHFNWNDCLIDAGITGAISAFACYAGLVTSGIPELVILKTCLIAFGSAFFGFIALKRGLTRKEE